MSKCPLCKFLNTREEARKHLNGDSVRSLRNAFKQIAIPMSELRVVLAKCKIHADYSVAADHLVNAGDFINELADDVIEGTTNISGYGMQSGLNKYPDPRKKA